MTRARELADLSNASVFTIDNSYNVGLGTETPDAKLDVIGIVSATTYYGDGSNLDNVTSTTINNNADNRLITGSGTANTLNGESTCTYDGATFVTPAATVGSAVTINSTGVDVTGVVTATSFTGDGTGLTGVASTDYIITSTAATFSNTTDSTSISTGAVQISGGVGIAKSVFIGGNLSVGGTVTYEDVTEIDSVGVVTAGKGLRVTSEGIVVTAGVTTLPNVGAVVGTGVTINSDGIDCKAGLAITASIIGKASFTTLYGDATNLTNIPAGSISTEALTSSGITTVINLTNAQDHKITATGIVTVTTTGGTEGESHTLRVVNSGVSSVGFSTYFLWPGGSYPGLPTADGSISEISFTIHREGAAGIGTQLLAGASLNFS